MLLLLAVMVLLRMGSFTRCMLHFQTKSTDQSSDRKGMLPDKVNTSKLELELEETCQPLHLDLGLGVESLLSSLLDPDVVLVKGG